MVAPSDEPFIGWIVARELIRAYRGRGIEFGKFCTWTDEKAFPVYLDTSRQSRNGKPVRLFKWSEIKAFLDSVIVRRVS